VPAPQLEGEVAIDIAYGRSCTASKREPGCGSCANCGPGQSGSAEEVTISAINRNFPGRSWLGNVWLASLYTVAASALAGKITPFEQLEGARG
jgi:3-isopropylmalate/(R)-2-methylmalate dehydratase large subunit